MGMTNIATIDLSLRLASVHAAIEQACRIGHRDPATVTLIAISKTFPAEAIEGAVAAGLRVFGENRVQEAKAKWPPLRETYKDVKLHLIGPLQSNKTREAIELFDAIHSLDREKLANALRGEIDRLGRVPQLFIQVNTGEEPQKAGVAPQDAPRFIGQCREELKLPIVGLMCIPPVDEPAAPHFALLAKIARAEGLPYLSMGMSDDFETAIRFGATHVRIGTAIFGARRQF